MNRDAYPTADPPSTAGLCIITDDEAFACHGGTSYGATGPPVVAWHGDGYGFGWADHWDGGLFFTLLDAGGDRTGGATEAPYAMMWLDLVWVHDHFVGAFGNLQSLATSLGADGQPVAEPLLLLPLDEDLTEPILSLAAAGDVVAATWADDEGVRVRVLEGPMSADIVLPAAPSPRPRLALADSLAMVAWFEIDQERFEVFIAPVDLALGRAGPSRLIASDRGEARVAVTAVPHGFVVVWAGIRPDRVSLSALATAVDQDLSIISRTELVVYEATAAMDGELSVASAAQDVYVAASFDEPVGGALQVHLGMLSCRP
jgi:hypothetical protein